MPDPLAQFIGANDEELDEFSYADAVKLADKHASASSGRSACGAS